MTSLTKADGISALSLPPKTRKSYRTQFVTAHRACRAPAEREQLAAVIEAGWTEAELNEYARLRFFRNGKDYPTAVSYREAVADILTYSDARSWRKHFRKSGSSPLPPRPERLLVRGRGFMIGALTSADYSWPGHTEEYRSMIEQRCRAYFGITAEGPVHVNAWAASQRAYSRELLANAEAVRQATFTVVLSPRFLEKSKTKMKAPRRKIISSHDVSFWGSSLKRNFDYYFKGHTPEFREEVAALARKDYGLRPNAKVSPTRWKAACHKHFVLIERPNH